MLVIEIDRDSVLQGMIWKVTGHQSGLIQQ